MSENLTDGENPARPSSLLVRPEHITALEEAVLHISSKHGMSFIEQLTLAGAARLLIKGAITRDSLTLVACELYGAPQPPNDGDTLSETLAVKAVCEAWSTLEALSHGTPLEELTPDNSLQQWVGDVLHALNQASRWGQVNGRKIAEAVPDEALDHLYSTFARTWYGCLEAVGRSLETPPGGSVASGLTFGTTNQGIHFAHAMANALRDSLNNCQLLTPHSVMHTAEQSNVHLWTRLLKAYLFSVVQRNVPDSVFEVLAKHPKMLDDICTILEEGVKFCQRARQEGVRANVQWAFTKNDYSQAVWDTKTSDIIAKLKDLVAQAQKDMSFGPPL